MYVHAWIRAGQDDDPFAARFCHFGHFQELRRGIVGRGEFAAGRSRTRELALCACCFDITPGNLIWVAYLFCSSIPAIVLGIMMNDVDL